MWVMQWEYWVVDNWWYVSWPYTDISEAEEEAIDCMNSSEYSWQGNLCVVKVEWCYDDYTPAEESDED